MTTLVIRGDGTATSVVSSECEKNAVIKRAAEVNLGWCATSKIPDPNNPTKFLPREYRLHFRRKSR